MNGLLTQLNLGEFGTEIAAHLGRNDNWSGTTTTGAEVFVKQVGGDGEEADRRFARLIAFEGLVAQGGGPRSPRCLGWDEQERLIVFELLDDAESGAELASDDRFTPEVAHAAGAILADLHGLQAQGLDETPAPLPPLGALRALTLDAFAEASAAELEAWSLLQHDAGLVRALVRMREREREAPQVPVHGDLRLDQFLLTADGTLHLTDWEELRRGDAARDVGGFAGEWLHRAILGIASPQDESVPELDPTHAAVVERGVQELERLRPNVVAFWAGYRETATTVDPDLAERATAFAGWHLLDRMLASASQRPRLRAVERAAAGIGRTALLDPARFVDVLGLGRDG